MVMHSTTKIVRNNISPLTDEHDGQTDETYDETEKMSMNGTALAWPGGPQKYDTEKRVLAWE